MKKSTLTALFTAVILLIGAHQVGRAQVVISQVYGAGGNSGATYKNDFIELFNRGATTVDISGWSVQYGSATGSTWTNTTAIPASTNIAPGQYYLIQEGGGTVGIVLPTPDLTGTISLAAGAGKVALCNNTTALSGACPTGGSIVDFVGYGTTANCYEGSGPTPAPSTTNSVMRASNGCTDNNQNSTDFSAVAVSPRNSASPLNACTSITTPNPTSLLPFSTSAGIPSVAQTFTVGGTGLTANLVITAPTPFELRESGTGSYGTSVSFTPTSGTVSTKTIEVRIAASAPVGSITPTVVTCTSTGATPQNVSVSGNVGPAGSPAIIVDPVALTGFSYFGAGPSTAQSFQVSGTNLTNNLSIAASTDYEISLTSGSGYTSPLTFTPSGGSVPATTIYVRLKAGLAIGNYNGETINVTSSGASPQVVTCSGTVLTPTITVGTLVAFGNQLNGTTSAEKTYSVSGVNLSDAIIITPPVGFEISKTTGTGFVSNPSTLTLTPVAGVVAGATIFVRFHPTLVQAYTGVIAHTSTNAVTQNVAVSGSGVVPINVSTIAALRAGLTDGTVYKLTSEAIVTHQRPDANSNQIWLQDATGAIVTFDIAVNVTTDYNLGDGVTGLTGTLSPFNNLLELIPLSGADPGAPSSTGNVVTPLQKTLATITTADESKLISVPFVSFAPSTYTPNYNYGTSGVSYDITDGPGGTSVFRTLMGEADYINTPIPTTPQDMVALVGRFGNAMQITPRYAADMTPSTPLWISGWPKAENASPTGFNAKAKINVAGTSYFVVLPSGAPAPTSQQVKEGKDASGTPVVANRAGSIACTAYTEAILAVSGLTASTTYNVYFVAEAYTVLQASPVMVPVTTTAPTGTAPTLDSPTVTSVTDNSAVLGGTILTDGGNAISERGTVWSLTTPVLATSNKLAEGGTAVGVFTMSRTSLPAASLIHFAAYATNIKGTGLSPEGSFTTFATEPTNHVGSFAAGATTNFTIPLTWTDATGAVLPTYYLIKGSNVSYAAINDPADGTPESNSSSSSAPVFNAPYGSQNYTFTGLIAGTPYFFKIYPYTGSGLTINYKTSPAPMQCTGTTLSTAATYTWIGADNGLWTDAANWNPQRTTPANTDILQFTDGTTKTVTGVPTQTIGQLILGGSTTVNLQCSAAATLSIGGLGGTDLVIPAGCALNLVNTAATANSIVIALATGATGSIDGSMSFSAATIATAHRLTAINPSAITFNSGAVFTGGLNFSGSPFGTVTANANSVVFANGSTYIHQGGGNPFGISQPASAVVFQTGSLYKVTGAVTPAFSGRNYANMEYDLVGGPMPFAQTGGAAVTMDNLTVTFGTLNFNMTATPGHSINGNISVATGATLNFNPASTGTVNIQGNITVAPGGTFTTGAFSTLAMVQNVDITGTVLIQGTLDAKDKIVSGTGTLTFPGTSFLLNTTGNIIVGTTVSNVPDVTGVVPGMIISGAGIPANDAVYTVSGTGPYTIGLSVAATVAGTGVPITFSRNPQTIRTTSPDGIAGTTFPIANKTFDATGTYNYYGSVAQVTGSLLPATIQNLTISNAAGVSLTSGTTVNGNLSLTSSLLTLGANNLTLGASAAFVGTPSASNMVVATGSGELRKMFTAPGSFIFPVGDKTGTAEYSPVTLNFTTGTFTSAYAGVKLTNAAYAVGTDYLNRYWDISSSGITVFSCDAQFNYVLADVVNNENNIYCYRVPSNDLFSQANATNHYLTASGLNSFGTFTGMDQLPTSKTLNLTVLLESLYNPASPGTMREAKDWTLAGGYFSKWGAGIADKITVELRDVAAGHALAGSYIVDVHTNGNATVTIPAALSGNYFIVVKNRNSIDTWSSNLAGESFAGSVINYNFTDALTKAYHSNMKQIGSYICIFGGNANASVDAKVDGTDMALIDNGSTVQDKGYHDIDVTGDGKVDGSDMALIDNNSTALVKVWAP